jgi:4-diphosphocytidyl-2-C-methyl-D-erythritol kinase
MISFPNCKINLGLNITERRSDGFHNLETMFYPLNLSDVLEIIKSPDGVFSFQTGGIKIPGKNEDNLCRKAYEMLCKDFQISPVKIYLYKKIPIGAGLGGGSSDAAHSILLLNKLFDLKLSAEKMEDYARSLGSDCAFFIRNKPVFAWDKGDKFSKINISLKNYFYAIVKPEIHINTANAYSGITPNPNNKPLIKITKSPIEKWKNELTNDFEKPIFKQFPEIENIKSKLYEKGAVYSAMSGSGSAVYGIFENKPEIEDFFPMCIYFVGRF